MVEFDTCRMKSKICNLGIMHNRYKLSNHANTYQIRLRFRQMLYEIANIKVYLT